MTSDELKAFLEAGWEEAQRKTAHLPKPFASVYFSRDGNALDIYLDTSATTYSEWIKGEGADIGLHRDMETERLAGAHLPLYAKTLVIGGDGIPTIYVDIEKGVVEFEHAGITIRCVEQKHPEATP